MSPAAAPSRAARARLPLLLAMIVAAGCHRKAPGPEECVAFAMREVGVETQEQLDYPGVRDRVDELTTECLLTPYDRELIACVERGQPQRYCLREFELRHSGLERVTPKRRRFSPSP